MEWFQPHKIILLLLCLLHLTNAFFGIVIGAMFEKIFGEYIDKYIGSAAKYVFGGPTKMVADALVGVTPILGDIPFVSESGEQFIINNIGWGIGFAS